MNRKIQLFVALGLAISSVAVIGVVHSKASAEGKTYTVNFFKNYVREDFALSNGFKAKGNNLLYQTVQVSENSVVTKPTDPTRESFEFKGWFKEEECLNEWNFTDDVVVSNTRLFAKWGIGEKQQGDEPAYTPPSTVLPDSAETDYVIDSIMYFKVEDDIVRLPTSALMKLEDSKDDVLPLMEYRVKNNKTLTATFNANAITVTCGEIVQTIQVKNDSEKYVVSNTDYETKAKNYEKKALEEESHHVMLAGSSSIEFWTSSKEDLQPIVSYNHGIGGTTIEQWDKQLNQRLVFPYKPKMVVYYVGINNVINTSQNASEISKNLKNFLDHTHETLPNTKVQYIMMNLIPGYTNYFDTINEVNNYVVEYQKSNPWLTLINPGTALLKKNGQPNAAYFRTDGLHLSYYGYTIWGEIVKRHIIAGLEAD